MFLIGERAGAIEAFEVGSVAGGQVFCDDCSDALLLVFAGVGSAAGELVEQVFVGHTRCVLV